MLRVVETFDGNEMGVLQVIPLPDSTGAHPMSRLRKPLRSRRHCRNR